MMAMLRAIKSLTKLDGRFTTESWLADPPYHIHASLDIKMMTNNAQRELLTDT